MKILHRLEECFLVALFLGAFLSLIAQVLSRYIFPFPLPWTEELARFLFLWIVMFGAAYSMREGGLIAISVVVDLLPPRLTKGIALTMHVLILAFLLIVIWKGTVLAIKVSSLPTIAMEISSAWEYGALPLASVLMALRTCGTLRHIVKHGAAKSSNETLI